jgi:dual specificity tyrosine-phosphorylation-regulated kinase 2/3/4
LNFVHSIGLVHSDVKPENILLASYSRAKVKLIDFGSSCYLTDRQSSYIQSRSYRAPEVVLGLPYDGRIDIWSLGCVVAEMFTGEVTFQNDSIVSMLSRIEAISGPFPRHMVAQGRQSSRFFTKFGLLYEKVPQNNGGSNDSYSGESSNDDEKRKPSLIDVFQPKRTTLAARLGFAPDLMDRFDKEVALTREETRQALFCDLVRKLLTIDPEVRLTAAQALQHPAMLYASTLTEADVKYPAS